MQFGETLRKAREAKGLTHSQVAEETHMLVQIVQDMENEDFHRIAAAIYGRGFVRLFAECVGLDPRPLVAEFSELYENRGDASRKASPPPPPPESGAFDFGADAQPPQPDGAPPGTVQDDLAPQPPEGTRGLDLFDPGARAGIPRARRSRAAARRFAFRAAGKFVFRSRREPFRGCDGVCRKTLPRRHFRGFGRRVPRSAPRVAHGRSRARRRRLPVSARARMPQFRVFNVGGKGECRGGGAGRASAGPERRRREARGGPAACAETPILETSRGSLHRLTGRRLAVWTRLADMTVRGRNG